MSKKMINTTVLKSTDSQRVGIKEILSIENNDGSNGHRKHPKQPSLRETVNTLREIVIEGFKSVNSRFDRLEADVADLKVRMTKVENRIDKLDNKVESIENVLQRNHLY
jgi:chromosome segregation ATPase